MKRPGCFFLYAGRLKRCSVCPHFKPCYDGRESHDSREISSTVAEGLERYAAAPNQYAEEAGKELPKREAWLEIIRFLVSLPVSVLQILRLKIHDDGLRHSDIARSLGVSPSTVYRKTCKKKYIFPKKGAKKNGR